MNTFFGFNSANPAANPAMNPNQVPQQSFGYPGSQNFQPQPPNGFSAPPQGNPQANGQGNPQGNPQANGQFNPQGNPQANGQFNPQGNPQGNPQSNQFGFPGSAPAQAQSNQFGFPGQAPAQPMAPSNQFGFPGQASAQPMAPSNQFGFPGQASAPSNQFGFPGQAQSGGQFNPQVNQQFGFVGSAQGGFSSAQDLTSRIMASLGSGRERFVAETVRNFDSCLIPIVTDLIKSLSESRNFDSDTLIEMISKNLSTQGINTANTSSKRGKSTPANSQSKANEYRQMSDPNYADGWPGNNPHRCLNNKAARGKYMYCGASANYYICNACPNKLSSEKLRKLIQDYRNYMGHDNAGPMPDHVIQKYHQDYVQERMRFAQEKLSKLGPSESSIFNAPQGAPRHFAEQRPPVNATPNLKLLRNDGDGNGLYFISNNPLHAVVQLSSQDRTVIAKIIGIMINPPFEDKPPEGFVLQIRKISKSEAEELKSCNIPIIPECIDETLPSSVAANPFGQGFPNQNQQAWGSAPANAPANAPGQVNPRVQSNQSAYQGYGSYTAVNPANAAANAPGQANAAANDPFNNTVNVSSNYRQSTVRNSTFQGYNGPTFSISDSADQIYYDDDIQRRFDALTFSSESPDDGVVSPFVLKDEKFISKNCPEGIVVDVSTFSSSILFLMKTGRIIRKKISDGSKDVVTSNIRAKRLESFAGYLYAIADGVIYQLNNTSYDSNNWEWKLCSWAPTGVIYTSTNPTKTLLWIQTANNAYLYDKSLTAITTLRFSSGLRRNYGTNQDEYIDYDPDTCRGTLTRNGEKSPLSDVCSVVFDQYGQPIPLNKNESVRHREIRILNWKPYYIPRDTS